MTPSILIAAILTLRPSLAPELARRHADVIYETTSDEADAAMLIVTAYRETRFKVGCIVGLGGWGTYGLGVGYRHWSCSTLKIQAVMSLQALYDKGWASDELKGIRGYLGAKSDVWPEIGVRVRLWNETRARISCGCSR